MNMLARYRPQWIREDFVDFVLEQVNPMWSWKKAKAQVVAVEAVASDFYQVSLLPNTHFNTQQIRAGQSLLVTRCLRVFISSAVIRLCVATPMVRLI